jgi:hypothetical protein
VTGAAKGSTLRPDQCCDGKGVPRLTGQERRVSTSGDHLFVGTLKSVLQNGAHVASGPVIVAAIGEEDAAAFDTRYGVHSLGSADSFAMRSGHFDPSRSPQADQATDGLNEP